MLELNLQLPRRHFTLEVNCQLPSSGITAIFGRSGCGKTSLLRAIAGLEPTAYGSILFQGSAWQTPQHKINIEQRRIGMVFQQANLFPHLSVEQNLLYGYQRTTLAQRKLQPVDVYQMLQLAPLLSLTLNQLSGGQRQRIALARALLTSPQLLLLDEPLAALDIPAKQDILLYLQQIAQHSGIPMLLVSHQLEDIVQLADQIMLLRQGQLISYGPLQQQLSLPAFAEFGAVSVLHCAVKPSKHAHMLQLELGKQLLQVPAQPHNGHCRLRIQARDVSLSLAPLAQSSVNNQLLGTISGFSDTAHPAEQLVQLQVAGQPLQALLTRISIQRLGLQPGLQVYAQIKAVAIH